MESNDYAMVMQMTKAERNRNMLAEIASVIAKYPIYTGLGTSFTKTFIDTKTFNDEQNKLFDVPYTLLLDIPDELLNEIFVHVSAKDTFHSIIVKLSAMLASRPFSESVVCVVSESVHAKIFDILQNIKTLVYCNMYVNPEGILLLTKTINLFPDTGVDSVDLFMHMIVEKVTVPHGYGYLPSTINYVAKFRVYCMQFVTKKFVYGFDITM